MEELKNVFANNLITLRTKAGLTQLQLAEMLNYSDKAISKWERGESIPDVSILLKIAEIFHITIDELLHPLPEKKVLPHINLAKRHLLITLLSVGLVWFIAVGIFAILYLTQLKPYAYLAFCVAPFAMSIVLQVFSAMWGNRFHCALSASGITWSVVVIGVSFTSAFGVGSFFWPFFIVAGVFQILIVLWFIFRKVK